MGEYEKLTAFLPLPEGDGIGEWVFDKGKDGVITMPYVRCSETVERFIDALTGKIGELSDGDDLFPYYEVLSENGLSYEEHIPEDADVSKPDGRTVVAMMNAVLAGERFSDGAIGRFITNGCMRRWLERLKELDERNG